jgi:hypothetical protein
VGDWHRFDGRCDEVSRASHAQGRRGQIACPLLVTHGGADRQIPVEQAQQTYEAAVNSPSRKLVVLGPEDGGIEHCSIDNGPLIREIACNWIVDVLRAQPDVRGV